MPNFTNQTPASTYPDILTIGTLTQTGLTNVLSPVQDGLGILSPLSLSTIAVNINRAGAAFSLDGVAVTSASVDINSMAAPNPIALGSGSFTAPKGPTANRPFPPIAGMERFNTDTSEFEGFNGTTWVNFAVSGGVVTSITGALNQIDINNINNLPQIGDVTVSVNPNYAGQASIVTVGTITTGTWHGNVIDEVHGGTDQTSYIIGDTLFASATNSLAKLPGNITNTKKFLSQTGTGVISAAPIWSTITGTDITGAALTKTDDTNVTLTLGGSPNTALLRATSLTLGWTGQLSLARGGTNADLSGSVSNGGIVFSTAASLDILAGTATANQVLLSGSNAAPSWSTATYPASTTINRLLYSTSNNVIGQLTTTNSAALTTDATGAPTWKALTAGQIIIGSAIGAPLASTITAGAGISVTNGNNSITITNTALGGSQAYAVDTGVANAYVVTLPSAPLAYSAGMIVNFLPANTNTADSTINVNGLGPQSIALYGSTTFNGSEIVAGQIVSLIFDGTNFNIVSNIPAIPLTEQLHGVDSGAADAYVITLQPPLASFVGGIPVGTTLNFIPNNPNTGGACSITIDGLGPFSLLTYGLTNPLPGVLNNATPAIITNFGAGIWFLVTSSSITDGTQIFGIDTGVADAYVVDIFPNYTFVQGDGSTINFRAINNNTGPSTLNVNGFVASLVNFQGVDLGAGDINAGKIYSAVWNNTLHKYQLISPTAIAGSTIPITATDFLMLQSRNTANPIWSLNTWPDSNSQGDLLYGSANNVISLLVKDANATRYLANTGVANSPKWDQIDLTNGVKNSLPVANGGTGNNTFTAYSVITAGTVATGPFQNVVGVGVAGQVLTSAGPGALPAWQNASSSAPVDQTTTPVTLAVNTTYSANTGGLLTFNMPALVAFGSTFEIVGQGAGGWLIQLAGGQTANSSAGSTTVAGTLASTNRYDCVKLLCTVANTTFTVVTSSGAITNA